MHAFLVSKYICKVVLFVSKLMKATKIACNRLKSKVVKHLGIIERKVIDKAEGMRKENVSLFIVL